MHLTKRLISVAAVVIAAGTAFLGSTFEAEGTENAEGALPWSRSKETIYFRYSDGAMTNFINSAAVAFGEEENVRVIPILTPDSEYLEAINEASLLGEQVPDVYMISHDSLEKAYLAGLATQIQDMEGVCNGENFPPAALSAVSYKGMTVAYPLFFETSVLVYNETYLADWAAQIAMKDLLNAGEVDENPEGTDGIAVDDERLAALTEEYFANAVPATVDDIRMIANTYDVPAGVDILKWDVSDIFYNYWIVGNYIEVGGDSGDDPRRININNPEAIQCLEVYKNLNQFFFIESDTVDYDSVLTDFKDGKLVFTIATTNAAEYLAEAKEEGEISFDYGFAGLPGVSGELDARAMSVTSVVAVNGYSRHEELANRFAAYLVNECADSLYEMTGKVPANLHADAENGALQVFKAEYAESISLPKMMETGNFWMQLEALFAKVWNGADVTTLLQELAEQITGQTGAAE